MNIVWAMCLCIFGVGIESYLSQIQEIEDDNLCGKELLEFEEQRGQTILKSSFEQYCF